jgi:hypothetical protein
MYKAITIYYKKFLVNFNGLICIYIELYLSISNIPKQLQCDLIKDFESEKGIVYRNV